MLRRPAALAPHSLRAILHNEEGNRHGIIMKLAS